MNILNKICEGKFDEAKQLIFSRLEQIVHKRLNEAKNHLATDCGRLEEATSPNIQRMGKIQKIRRRIRRNKKGRIIVQKNIRRSSIKGYRISGNTLKRIPASVRLRKSRLLKRSWQTSRKAQLRRTLLKRRMSMARRRSIGLR